MHKILGLLSLALTIWAMAPYIRDIHRNKFKPHTFSWLIWGSTTIIVGIAQYSENGGAGSWSFLLSGTITFYIAYQGFIRQADNSHTTSDKVFLIVSILSIPIWLYTQDPLYSVVLLTGIDILGYGPTLRKSYYKPFEESLALFSIMTLRNTLTAIALEHYSFTTLVFPLATTCANCVVIAVILIQRKKAQ